MLTFPSLFSRRLIYESHAFFIRIPFQLHGYTRQFFHNSLALFIYLS
jgi:hypothetical protein